MKQTITLSGLIMKLLARIAIAGPWRGVAERFACALGRRFPTQRAVLSFCRYVGLELLDREGDRFQRVACFASGGKMHCSGLNGISTTSLFYYFLGTINGQTEDERPIEKLLLHAIRPGDTFLDIGANYGFYSFLLGSLCGKSGAIHAFEANPVLKAHLMRSAELNKDTANIFINCVAIGSENRAEVILYDPERIGCSSLHQHEWVDSKKSVVVPQITIDEYRKKAELKRIDLVKIDIEGAELDAFRGMKETFEICPPGLIVCELMPLVNATTDGKNAVADLHRASSAANPVEIFDLLSSKGYAVHYIRDIDGRLGEVVLRGHLENLSQSIINVCFVRSNLKKSRPDLFARSDDP